MFQEYLICFLLYESYSINYAKGWVINYTKEMRIKLYIKQQPWSQAYEKIEN